MNTVFCKSEVDALKKVIIHYPDDGIEVVTPSNALEYLYDDIVHLQTMREEHQKFIDILSAFIGEENVIDTEDLLLEVFETIDKTNRDKFFNYLFAQERLTEEVKEKIKSLSNKDLVYTLFTGLLEETDESLLTPLPNYVFTRDIAVIVKDYLLICNPSKKARNREGVLTRVICYFHPLFKSCQEDNDEKIIDMTEYLTGSTVDGYLTQSGITSNTFVIAYDDYNSAGYYDLGNYMTLSDNATVNGLNFGDEYFFYGNLETDIQATIYELRCLINLGDANFQSSSNPGYTHGNPAYLTEIGLYDSDKELMIISKLQSPTLRQGIQQFLIKFDF